MFSAVSLIAYSKLSIVFFSNDFFGWIWFNRCTLNEQHDDWDSWLPYFTFFYNTTPHTEHSFAPFELVFGNQVNYPTKLKNITKIDPIYNFEAYFKELQFKLQTAAQKAKVLLEKSKEKRISKQALKSNPIEIQIGSKVWLKKENRRKLDPVYAGPFTIINIQHPNVTIKNQITNETQTVFYSKTSEPNL